MVGPAGFRIRRARASVPISPTVVFRSDRGSLRPTGMGTHPAEADSARNASPTSGTQTMGHILQTHERRGFHSPGAQGTDDPRDHVATMSDLPPRPRHQTTMVHRDSAKVVSLLGVHDGTHRVVDSVAGDGPSAVAL